MLRLRRKENLRIVKASENGMVYWLLHHYDVAELIGNKDGKLKQDLKEAVEKLYER